MDGYELTCEATVNGETFQVRTMMSAELHDNPAARKHAENWLRMTLVTKIVDRFPPEISARRVSFPSPWAA